MKHSFQRLALTLLALCAPLYMGADGCDTAMVGESVCETDAGLLAKGDHFNDSCNECTCEGAGQISCTERACNEGCSYDGETYADGDSFPAEDGCNTCTCGPDGLVGCTQKGCIAPNGCDYEGKHYDEIETWQSSDGCNSCSCSGGQAVCTDRACGDPGCDFGGVHFAPGEGTSNGGCGACWCEGYGVMNCTHIACPTGCDVDGMHYEIGDAILSDDGCNDCKCEPNSMISCASSCGTGGGCEYQGKHYDPGESFSDGCNGCSCDVNGNISCTANWCEPPTGTCTLGDRTFPSGTTVICEDGCNHCTCSGDEQWSTTLIGCPALRAAEPCDGTEPVGDPSEAVLYLSNDGDALALQAQYGGGCQDHSFKLCFSGFTGADPNTTQLWLVDEGEPDSCDALLNSDLVFDISPIRDSFSSQHPSLGGPLTLEVGGTQLSY